MHNLGRTMWEVLSSITVVMTLSASIMLFR
nr:unnamed protein product [Callosobruchus analis]